MSESESESESDSADEEEDSEEDEEGSASLFSCPPLRGGTTTGSHGGSFTFVIDS